MLRIPANIFVLFVLAISLFLPSSHAANRWGRSCTQRVNNTFEKLLECVTVEGVRQHQAAFQAIADANGGTRTSGTAGYDASVTYVRQVLNKAGYIVTVQPFEFQTFQSLTPAVLDQLAPEARPVPTNIMRYSAGGDVTAPVSTLPVVTGCDSGDFASFPAGNIALISRGGCRFAVKATNAYFAGASAAIIYNNGAGALDGTLDSDFTLDIPVTSVTLSVGQQLAATTGLVMRLRTETLRRIVAASNVVAEARWGNPDNIVIAGAHLDSVEAGPGIQDNGAASAALLEIAEQMAKVKPRNRLRFAWWAAEEAGLVGSTHYVSQLAPAEISRVSLYLNFDMIASPNYVFFVYDGDDSDGTGSGPGPPQSRHIENFFESYYTYAGQPFKGADFDGRSDYAPFIAAGIPAGGLFTGAEGIKTAEEAIRWGGTAGEQYDPCYHVACDTLDNISLTALDINADAIAAAILQSAMNTHAINGVKGKGNFKSRLDGWEFRGPARQR